MRYATRTIACRSRRNSSSNVSPALGPATPDWALSLATTSRRVTEPPDGSPGGRGLRRHAPQAPPREVGQLVGQGLGIRVAVGVEPVDAGPLDHPHAPVPQNPALARVEALYLAEAGHQGGHRPLGLVDQLGELCVPYEAPAVEQLEGVAVPA